MNSQNAGKIIIGIILLVLVGAGIYWIATQNNASPHPNDGGNNNNGPVTFNQTGNLVQNNPGMQTNVWYLVYEANGQPALNIPLLFNADSKCVDAENQTPCNPSTFTQGARVTIEGTKQGNVVTVEKLTLVDSGSDIENLIKATSPQNYAVVSSPLSVKGEARGSWFFEASFPVRLLDANGEEIATTTAHAEGDWMTDSFVPFTATLTYSNPSTDTGTIVLQKDNPSGLPQNDAELRIPVTFSQNERTVQLYYYDANKDKDADGNLLCSRQGLVAVDREIPVTISPIQDTVKLLLQGNLTSDEKNQGITTEFPLDGFTLKGANLENDGHLTLEFSDPENKTSGGSCRVSILWYQIEATAEQFPEVQSVSFIPEELFQP